MKKIVVSLMFIPTFIILYVSGNSGNILSYLGVVIIIILALSQIVSKN